MIKISGLTYDKVQQYDNPDGLNTMKNEWNKNENEWNKNATMWIMWIKWNDKWNMSNQCAIVKSLKHTMWYKRQYLQQQCWRTSGGML